MNAQINIICKQTKHNLQNISQLFLLWWILINIQYTLDCRRNTAPMTNMKYRKESILARTPPELTSSALPLMAQGSSVKLASRREVLFLWGLAQWMWHQWRGEMVRLWIWQPEDVWISVVFRRLDGTVRVQERWAKYKFFWMGWDGLSMWSIGVWMIGCRPVEMWRWQGWDTCKGRNRKTWRECVKDDMNRLGLQPERDM